jgi:hypothetical protein
MANEMYFSHELDKISKSDLMEQYIRLKLTQTYNVIRHKCEKTNLNFDFTLDDLAPFPLKCPVLGIDIDYFKKGHGGSNFSPSIDRMTPEEGYVKGNVRIISQKANRLKQDSSVEEQVRLLAYSTGVAEDDIHKMLEG